MRILTRAYLAVVGLIGLATGGVLLFAPATTADYFAWPIQPAQTAVFMGAGYLGTGITLGIALVMGKSWRDVRLIVIPVLCFATSMVTATLLHADRFRWERPVTWLWLGAYGVIIAGALAISLAIERDPAPDGSSSRPRPQLQRIEQAALLAVGGLTLSWAVPMFFFPAFATIVWPWVLTPLTARVVAGWISVAAALALVGGVANDARALRLPLIGWIITVGIFLVSSTLQLSAFATSDVRTVGYFGMLLASEIGSAWLLWRIQALDHSDRVVPA